jgi:hypothetical protein
MDDSEMLQREAEFEVQWRLCKKDRIGFFKGKRKKGFYLATMVNKIQLLVFISSDNRRRFCESIYAIDTSKTLLVEKILSWRDNKSHGIFVPIHEFYINRQYLQGGWEDFFRKKMREILKEIKDDPRWAEMVIKGEARYESIAKSVATISGGAVELGKKGKKMSYS